jgi:hypothetical protein
LSPIPEVDRTPGLGFRAMLTEGEAKVHFHRERPASLSEPNAWTPEPKMTLLPTEDRLE